jgi:hypothetical protein
MLISFFRLTVKSSQMYRLAGADSSFDRDGKWPKPGEEAGEVADALNPRAVSLPCAFVWRL